MGDEMMVVDVVVDPKWMGAKSMKKANNKSRQALSSYMYRNAKDMLDAAGDITYVHDIKVDPQS